MSHSARLGQFLMMLHALGAGLPDTDSVPLVRQDPPPKPPSKEPLSRPCTQCGAKVGVPCNRYTLGRHPYHLARMTPTDMETT